MNTRRGFLKTAAGAVGAGLVPAKTLWADEAAGRKTFRDDWDYLKRKWQEDVSDPSTGYDLPSAGRELETLVSTGRKEAPWPQVKAKMFAWLCDNVAIDVSPHDWFPAVTRWSRDNVRGEDRIRGLHPVLDIVQRRDREVIAARTPNLRCGGRGWFAYHDFDHSAPWWEDALKVGFPGMLARLEANWKDDEFHRVRKAAAEAILRFLDRFIVLGESRLKSSVAGQAACERLSKTVAALRRLRAGAPQTSLDVMLFVYLYWVVSEVFENVQVRTLGNLDRLLTPYYRADLAAGRTTEAEFRDQVRHFWWQWGSMNYYWGQPVFFGGTEADGSTCYNDVSKILLEIHDELCLPTPKLHLKMGKSTPAWVWKMTLDMARRQRSVTFCGEEPHWRVIRAMGYTREQAREFILWGCYEWALRDSANDTCGAVLCLLVPIVEMLDEAARGTLVAPTFDDFARLYEKRLALFVASVRTCVYENQRWMEEVNPTMLYTLATPYCIRTGRDAFAAHGMESGNNTGIWTVGLGTTVDALMAVKEIVYENDERGMKNDECRKIHFSLKELGEVMAKNWEGHEALRLRMLRSKRKWGNNDAEANALGRRIAKCISGELNGRPNSRGGVFKASGHSARNHIGLARGLGATPDGRRKGEEFSKNISPTMGADTEGVTALLNTVACLDACDLPGDFPLDVALLPRTAADEKGLALMRAVVEQYFANGGLVIQFNVHDAATLREAQRHPEKYENLQVRVCGWNVRWNDIPKVEQDKFIARAESIAD